MPSKRHCLILAAGLGTRMGDIGKVLPKVLWPVFEKSLLHIQLNFAQRLGLDSIYINLHYQHHLIKAACENLPDFNAVTWLYELPEILDVGGAIQNLASRPEVNYSGELLVLNADQFLWMTAHQINEWFQQMHLRESTVELINLKVNSNQGYNAVMFDGQNQFQGVVKNNQLEQNQEILTYSGNCLVNLSKLRPLVGASAFFESIANPKLDKVSSLVPVADYWDFGTAQRYWDSMYKILKIKKSHEETPFTLFLEEILSFDLRKFDSTNNSYGSSSKNVISIKNKNLDANHKNLEGPMIAIEVEDFLDDLSEGTVGRVYYQNLRSAVLTQV